MSNNLVEDREYWVHRKNLLIQRLAGKEGKAFDQVLKQIDRINFEIDKLTKIIKDHKAWK